MLTFYTSPTGNGLGLSLSDPANIQSALVLVKNNSAEHDIHLLFRGGVYDIASIGTLVLTALDGGRNGNTVTWQAYPSDPLPVLSGGIEITGWTADTGTIMKASAQGINSRNFYVDGHRCIRAHKDVILSEHSLYSRTGVGTAYTCTDATMPNFSRPQDLEFHFFGKDDFYRTGNASIPIWMHIMCGVAGTSKVSNTTAFTMMDEADNALLAYYDTSSPESPGLVVEWPASPSIIENAYEFLDATTKGHWYLNTATDTIYYVPLDDEVMANVKAYLPVLEQVIAADQVDPPKNLRIIGISIEHTTWMKPTDQKAFLEWQGAQGIHRGANGWSTGQYNTWDSPNTYMEGVTPAAIELDRVENFELAQMIIKNVGTSGLQIGTGSKNNSIKGSQIESCGGHGVYMGQHWAPNPSTANKSSYNLVYSNLIKDIGLDWRGGNGVFSGFMDNSTAQHNHLENMPYSGLGWGWGWTLWDDDFLNPGGSLVYYSHDNHILDNYIYKSMQVLGDGGAIYWMSRCPNATILRNFIRDVGFGGVGLYSETGCYGQQYHQNVVTELIPFPTIATKLWGKLAGWVANFTVSMSSNYAPSGYGLEVVGDGIDPGETAITNSFATSPTWVQGAKNVVATAGRKLIHATGEFGGRIIIYGWKEVGGTVGVTTNNGVLSDYEEPTDEMWRIRLSGYTIGSVTVSAESSGGRTETINLTATSSSLYVDAAFITNLLYIFAKIGRAHV